MQVRFSYRLTHEQYSAAIAALTDQLAVRDKRRMQRLLEQLGVMVAILVVIALAFPQALPGLLVASMLATILFGALQGRWVRGVTGISFEPELADHEVELTDVGLSDRSSLRERKWSWAAVRRVHELDNMVVVELVGWDMLVLPDHLWPDASDRLKFVEELGTHAAAATFVKPSAAVSATQSGDLLTLGAVGAGVDVLALVLFLLPLSALPSGGPNQTAFLATLAVIILVGVGLAYAAYRLARKALERLQARAPSVAVALANLLILAVPAYMLLAYFRMI